LSTSCAFTSGLGLPFSMPIDLRCSTLSLTNHGSLCTMRSSDWKAGHRYDS
jgi:hypothetical protein